VFERFYRADPARSRQTEGAGLGLALAKWIVERHGGTIDLTSRPAEGSTLTVRLPRPTA
jgi:signal transduction histidine kinase